MLQRHIIRLLQRSSFISTRSHKISFLSARNHLFSINEISSQKCSGLLSQLKISLPERVFSSDSKIETEVQFKDTSLTDNSDIPNEGDQKPISSSADNQAKAVASDVESQAETITPNDERQSELRSSVVYMRGLPYSVTKEEIIEFFKPLDITPVKVIMRSDRFGFTNGKAEVEFETLDDATKALKKQNHYIGNRYIELSLDPFPQMNADRMGFKQRDYDDFRDPFYSDNSAGYTVKLGGLPYDATIDNIHEFFANLNIKPIEINLKYSTSGQPLGLCFVKFKTREEALEALKNNNEYMGSRYIKVTMMRSSQGRMQFSGGMYDDQRSFGRFSDGIKTFDG